MPTNAELQSDLQRVEQEQRQHGARLQNLERQVKDLDSMVQALPTRDEVTKTSQRHTSALETAMDQKIAGVRASVDEVRVEMMTRQDMTHALDDLKQELTDQMNTQHQQLAARLDQFMQMFNGGVQQPAVAHVPLNGGQGNHVDQQQGPIVNQGPNAAAQPPDAGQNADIFDRVAGMADDRNRNNPPTPAQLNRNNWWDDGRRRNGRHHRQDEEQDDFHRTCKLVGTLPKYNGTGSFEGFMNTFEKLTVKCDVEEDEKLQLLQICLQDQASKFEMSLPEAIRNNYRRFKERLEARYGEDTDPTTAKIELNAITQLQTETEDEFAEKLERLVQKAHATAAEDTKDDLLTHHFLRGCQDRDAAYAVSQQRPAVRNLAQVLKAYKSSQSSRKAILRPVESLSARMVKPKRDEEPCTSGYDSRREESYSARRYGYDDRYDNGRSYGRYDNRGRHRRESNSPRQGYSGFYQRRRDGDWDFRRDRRRPEYDRRQYSSSREREDRKSQPWRSWRGDRSSSMERDSSRERGRYSGPRRSDRENWRHRSSDYREHQSYHGRKLNREYSKDRYDYNRRRRDDNRGRYRFDRRDSSEDRYSSRDRQTRSGVENRNARQKPPRARDNKERRAEDIRKEHASSDHSSDSSTKNE